MLPLFLQVILPRLRDLVDQETRWLQEQGVPGAASAARSTGVSGRASQVGTAGAAGDPQYAPANLAPGSAPQQQQQQQAAAEEPAAVDPEGNVLDGNTEAAAYPEEDEENGGAGGSDRGSGAAAADAAAASGPDEEQQAPIRSPWSAVGGNARTSPCSTCHSGSIFPWCRALAAGWHTTQLCSTHHTCHPLRPNNIKQEIEALDEEASGRQEANRQLEAELASLHDSDMLVLAGER